MRHYKHVVDYTFNVDEGIDTIMIPNNSENIYFVPNASPWH